MAEWKSIQIRGEFFNALNRVYLNSPTSGNPAASVTRNSRNELTGGFGFINPGSVASALAECAIAAAGPILMPKRLPSTLSSAELTGAGVGHPMSRIGQSVAKGER